MQKLDIHALKLHELLLATHENKLTSLRYLSQLTISKIVSEYSSLVDILIFCISLLSYSINSQSSIIIETRKPQGRTRVDYDLKERARASFIIIK